MNAFCYGENSATLDSNSATEPVALTVGDQDQPITLTAGSTTGDGFTVCWWSLTGKPAGTGATVSDVVALVTDANSADRNLVVGLGGEQIRVQYGSGTPFAREHLLAYDKDWEAPHQW